MVPMQVISNYIICATLANPRYVYLTRRDHLRQAISLTRAIQSGQWRSMDLPNATPCYDAASISHEMQSLKDEETDWEDFFTRNGVCPYRLAYEDLVSAPQEVITGLLTFLGHEGPTTISFAETRHGRQADDVTEQWLHRYVRDRGAECEEHTQQAQTSTESTGIQRASNGRGKARRVAGPCSLKRLCRERRLEPHHDASSETTEAVFGIGASNVGFGTCVMRACLCVDVL
jgi:hypothetical protein